MSERTLRRAAERKARKEAYKAQKVLLRAAAASASANNANNNDNHDDDPPVERKPNERSPLVDWDKLESYAGPRIYPEHAKFHPPTKAKLEANRANAQLSTGPRSLMGKAISAQNSFEHGLTSGTKFRVLECEDADVFEQMRQELYDDHKPQTPTEAHQVERMAQHNWLHERALGLQQTCFDQQTGEIVSEKKFLLYERYANTHERAFVRCITTLAKLRKERQIMHDGFVREKNERAQRECDIEVEKLSAACREKGDWSEFWTEVYKLRDRMAAKYRPPV